MGFRYVTPDSPEKQNRDAKECCPTHLKEWNCGCSWGCDVCFASYRCSVCGCLFNEKGKYMLLWYHKNNTTYKKELEKKRINKGEA